MKTYRVKAVRETEENLVLDILQNLQRKGTIVFEEERPDGKSYRSKEATPATEEQVQEIIDEAELGPYYSEQEAKNILHL
ncbi:hypothetical protein [Dyadobacter sp. OTU695]|uniref:hypothetical protein n=1 Tax=Dyadobacter sp. OTU695 TaxID=3043860 RepID=UPI00313DD9F8